MPVHPSRHPSSLRVVPATFRPPVAGPAFRLGRSRLPLLGRPTTWLAAAATLSAACAVVAAAPTAQASAATTTSAFQVGPRPNATRLSFTVGDRITATADVGTGNLLLTTTDATLPGIGSDVSLGLDFNSLLLRTGSPLPAGTAGAGWAMRLGADTKLIANVDGSVLYLAPEGLEWLFPSTGTGTYGVPAGIKANLTSVTGGGWTLDEHSSGRKLTFNATGKLTSIADRNTNATTLNYTSGVLTTIIASRGSTPPRSAAMNIQNGLLIQTTQVSNAQTSRAVLYGYTSGRLTSITDPTSRVTSFGYDTTTGDLTSITNPGGGVTQFAYNSTHQVTKVTQVNPTSGGPGDSVTRLAYPDTNTTQVADPDSNLTQTVAVAAHATYALDASDRVLNVTDAEGKARAAQYTPNGDTTSSTAGGTAAGAAGSSTTTAAYNANSGESLTQVQGPSGASASLAYSNPGASTKYQPSGGTDSQGNTSAFGYDTAGNLQSNTGASGGADAATASVTYHSDGTVATSTDPGNSASTVYTEDTTTHQLTGIDPVGSTLGNRTFTYDQYSRLATATDGAGRTTTYGYDDADRPTKVSFSDGTTAVTYAYGAGGRLKTRTDASGTTTYGYDPLGHLATRSNTSGGGTISYGYDPAGHQTSLTDTRGTTAYTYTAGGQLSTVKTAAPANTLITFKYDTQGRRTDTYYGDNGTQIAYSVWSHTDYWPSGRAQRVRAVRGDGSGIADTSYCYAAHSTVQSCSTAPTDDRPLAQIAKDNLTGSVFTNGYDTSNRLISATGSADTALNGTTGPVPPSFGYTYDVRGNRLSATAYGTTTSSTFSTANLITDPGASYDGAGSLTASTSLGTATYNAAGQMKTATNTVGGNGTYTYAGPNQNELVAQTVPGGTTVKYTYGRTDRNGLPEIEQVSIGGTYGYIDHDPTTSQPLVLHLTNGNEAYYVYDGLARPVALTTAAGTTGTYSYDPYGVTTTAGSGAATGQSPYRWAPGSIYDRTTGMLKYGQRWYSPTTGRFTQQDSITHLTDPQQGNKYAYAGDDPVNNGDATGQDFLGDVVSAVAGSLGLEASGIIAEAVATGLAEGTLGAVAATGLVVFGEVPLVIVGVGLVYYAVS